MVLVLVALQLWIGTYRGQAMLLCDGEFRSADAAALCLELALHEHRDIRAHGSHHHDDLPPHLHVPEDEASSRSARGLVHLPRQEVVLPWHAHVAAGATSGAGLSPAPDGPAAPASRPAEATRALRTIRLRI